MIQKVKLTMYICLIVCIEILLLFLVDIWILNILILFHIHICIHELFHVLAYIIQKIDVYCISIIPIKIINNEKFTIKLNFDIRYLGMVIPKIDDLSKEELLKVKNKFSKAIIMGSISNLILASIFFVLEVLMDSRYISVCLIINLLMFVMGVGENDYVKGDIIAFFSICKDTRFYFLNIYTYLTFDKECTQENSKKMIKILESEVLWNKYDNENKKIIYNIFQEQLNVNELCISREFLENVWTNKSVFIENAKNKYVDYVICNKIILVYLKYNYGEKALYIYNNICENFPMNDLLIESEKQLFKHKIQT